MKAPFHIRLLLLFFVLLLSISSWTCRQTPGLPSSNPATVVTPPSKEQDEFAPATPILPQAELIAFFASQSDSVLFRMPIVIEKSENPLQRWKVFVGVTEAVPQADRFYLDLDDTALGIPLSSRFQDYIGEQEYGYAWIHCKKGNLLDLGLPVSAEEQARTFTVYETAKRTAPNAEDAYIFMR